MSSWALVMVWGLRPVMFPHATPSKVGRQLCAGGCMGLVHICNTYLLQYY